MDYLEPPIYSGLGLELEQEAHETLQKIRNGWTREEREQRAIGPTLQQMIHTFHIAHVRLSDKEAERDRRRMKEKRRTT